MAPAVIAAIISALGSMGASYLNSRTRQPGPLGGPGNASAGYTPVSSSMASEALKAGTDITSAMIQQKIDEERRRREEEMRRQQAQQQSVGASAGYSTTGGLRGAIEMALNAAFRR